MIRNYFKLALRNIGRKKLYTIINLTGLGVASAFCILVYWYVQHEDSFDKFQTNADYLYRVEFSNFNNSRNRETKPEFFSFLMKNSEQQNMIQTPVIFAGELQKDFPEIENTVRIMQGYEIIVRVNDQSFKEEKNSAFVDKDFFTVFNFPLAEGNASTVLSGRNQIVLSEKAAKKYFGKEEPVGKTILLPNYKNTLYTVSGVAKDFPVNSSFQFDFIMPRESVPDYADEVSRGLNTFSDLLILQFYTETQLLAFLAVIIGLILAVTCLPLFSNLIGSDLWLSYFSFTDIVLLLFGLAVLLGVLAGIYPALVMSGLKPLNMMRKFSAYRLNPFFAKVLMITQFSVCIILIISSLVISSQMRYINTTELGFDKDQVITIENPFVFDEDINKTYQLRDRLSHYISEEPAVEGITCNGYPFEGYNNTNNHIINGEKTMVHAFDVDYNYFSFFKIPIIKGRCFLPEIKNYSVQLNLTEAQLVPGSSAARQAVVVNETLYNLLGHPKLNQFNRELGGIIIGVCKDYHSDDLTKKISPVYHRIYS